MPIIALVGPNAIGKTTAARRWASWYPKLVCCLCDVRRVIENGKETIEEFSWKDQRELLITKYKQVGLDKVVVVESASGFGLRIGGEINADHWLVVTCGWESSLRQRMDRCRKLGKEFRHDVWTQTRLGYESERRILNFTTNQPNQSLYTYFRVENIQEDWNKVDEYFQGLYRKFNNGLIRRTINHAKIGKGLA